MYEVIAIPSVTDGLTHYRAGWRSPVDGAFYGQKWFHILSDAQKWCASRNRPVITSSMGEPCTWETA